MKTYSPNYKIAIRELLRRATATDPGCVHPEYLLTPTGGGIQSYCIQSDSRPTCSLAVHFLPAQSATSTRWISFNLN